MTSFLMPAGPAIPRDGGRGPDPHRGAGQGRHPAQVLPGAVQHDLPQGRPAAQLRAAALHTAAGRHQLPGGLQVH
jgi:hypothetical protein